MKILFLLGLFIICWELFWYLAGVRQISPWRLKKWLQRQDPDVKLIDVRTPFEYRWFHIENAENRPEMAFMVNNFKEPDPAKRIVIICMTGHRSPVVAGRLKKRGYTNVYNLTWGMWAWKLFGGKTVGSK
jgi:rhodanese-related sulfurtransferase